MTAAARSAPAASHWLDALDAAGCASLLGAAADLLLVVDATGRVLDVDTTLDTDTDTGIAFSSWTGRPLEQLLRAADRPRLRRLLTAARGGRGARRQVLAHVAEGHAPLFVEYAALALGTAGRVLLVGRDRSALAGLAAQLADERLARERARRDLRRAESRYQQLFDCLPGALLVVDAANQRVLEVNDAAERLFERPAAALLGRPLASLFGRAQRARLAEW
ncbi:MAG: PAS domain-containing protein, partial [Gammaproteobacteria bacterium]|nr:PAS domain-containing protein [Gammaproteobacteria bacterium]